MVYPKYKLFREQLKVFVLEKWKCLGVGNRVFFVRSGMSTRVKKCHWTKHNSKKTYLETVTGFLPVPDGPRQREFATHPIFSNSSQRPPTQLLRFGVVSLEPKLLKFGVVVRRELIAL